jgi:CheY-like chemotaxis protein
MAAELSVGTGNGRPATAERSGECRPEGATGGVARGGSPAANPEMAARLTGEVAHAINNALAVILGNLELIASRPGDPERTLRLVERAVEAVQRATQQTQRLRVAAMPLEQTTTNRSESSPESRQSPDGEASLLVVDDDPNVLEVARANLSDLGYRVTSATNGREALTHLRSALPVDLLFTDIVMPEMNGLQLTDEARRLRPGIKILLTSGYATDTLLTGEHQFADLPPILAKPYWREQLARTVSAMLDEIGRVE